MCGSLQVHNNNNKSRNSIKISRDHVSIGNKVSEKDVTEQHHERKFSELKNQFHSYLEIHRVFMFNFHSPGSKRSFVVQNLDFWWFRVLRPKLTRCTVLDSLRAGIFCLTSKKCHELELSITSYLACYYTRLLKFHSVSFTNIITVALKNMLMVVNSKVHKRSLFSLLCYTWQQCVILNLNLSIAIFTYR